VLVAGLHGPARAAVVDRLLREHPGSLAIHHDLRQVTSDAVVRTVRDAVTVLDRAVVRLAHGCVTCTVRDDLVPELLRHAIGTPLLIVDLWDCVEPRSVAEALDAERGALRLTAVLTALDAELTPMDICRGERLAEVGKPGAVGDERYLAEVLARQIEYATALVLPEPMPYSPAATSGEHLELCTEVLGHLAPMTPVILPDSTLPELAGAALCVAELAARVDPATAQLPCDTRTTAATTLVWRRTGPLHPARFFDAVDELAADTVRSRGRFWLANRPDRMLALDAVAGIVTVEDAGPWLACLPDADWEMIAPAHRLAAALDWSPEGGDRIQHLVFTGPDLDRDDLHRLLDSCLLGSDEQITGLDDPFAYFLDLPVSST
jgi:G3E family GTPase